MNLPHPARIVRGAGGRQLLRSWYVFFFQIPKLPEALLSRRRAHFIGEALRRSVDDPDAFPEDAIEVFRENASRPGALTAMIHWYRASFRHVSDLRTLVEATPLLDVPTLMVWGEKDPALGVELTTGTERLVRDFTIRYLPVSHWVQHEAPDEVNAIIAASLASKPVPGSPLPTTASSPGAHPGPEASNEGRTGGTST
jgi:pimeloyl-ACP methyl ester carboxylesterase